ncbi:hypothetical protein [Tenacibaculum adriaticum]|nr:hypothetical protein [Tenacibaculum adriaticum]
MDIKKLIGQSASIKKQAFIEELENIPISFFEFNNSEISNFSLNNTKTGITADVSPRALNRWIDQGVVIIEESDKGKTRRFNRLESIWIKIAVELRNFGVSLNDLKYIREQLFDYTFEGFNMFKFKILKNILTTPEYIVISEHHQVGFYPYSHYAKLASKGFLLSHINIRFIDYIKEEFPNNSLNTDFGIKDFEEDINKVSLLYYLKTNDFKEIRITLSDGDIRLLNNSSQLKNNSELLEQIQNWNFKAVKIIIDTETEYIIDN